MPWVGHLRLVELYLDRASEAWRALKMHEAATPERYVLDKFIERGTGPLPRPLDAGYRGAEYDFITAETRITPTGEVESPMPSTPGGRAPRSGPFRPRGGWCAIS